jgi:hypothetical protein
VSLEALVSRLADAFLVIHIGFLSNRIPVLPPFAVHAGHLGGQASVVAVSEVFDLTQLSSILEDLPIVELHELKVADNLPDRLVYTRYDGEAPLLTPGGDSVAVGELVPAESTESEGLGCWSISEYEGRNGYWIDSPNLSKPVLTCYPASGSVQSSRKQSRAVKVLT